MKLNELNVEYKQMEYQKERKKEILCEGKYKNFQFYILNLGTHPTAYVEIPRDSILFGKGYNQIDIDVHGGLTFADSSLIGVKTNSWFIGWDYAHCTDYIGYDIDFEFNRSAKRWTTEEIFEDVVSVIEQLINTDWEKQIINKEARELTENHIKNEFDKLVDNYMEVYDEYYDTGSRDSAFLKDLVDSIIGISAVLEVYVRDKHIHASYVLEKLRNSRSYIDSTIRYFESKLGGSNNEKRTICCQNNECCCNRNEI